MLVAMAAREAALGADVPVLVHSDLAVVDDALQTLHPSFVALQRIEGDIGPEPARVLVANCVTGCATLVNAPLMRCALPMPDVAMHDWWLAQCAAACGEIVFLPEAMVRTFELYGSRLPASADEIAALSDTYAAEKGRRWDEERGTKHYGERVPSLGEVVAYLREALDPKSRR